MYTITTHHTPPQTHQIMKYSQHKLPNNILQITKLTVRDRAHNDRDRSTTDRPGRTRTTPHPNRLRVPRNARDDTHPTTTTRHTNAQPRARKPLQRADPNTTRPPDPTLRVAPNIDNNTQLTQQTRLRGPLRRPQQHAGVQRPRGPAVRRRPDRQHRELRRIKHTNLPNPSPKQHQQTILQRRHLDQRRDNQNNPRHRDARSPRAAVRAQRDLAVERRVADHRRR